MASRPFPQAPFFCINNDMIEAESLHHPLGTLFAFSTRSPDKTTPNEDSIAVVSISDEHLVCVVADGLGGQPSGDQASAMTIDLLINRLTESDYDSMDLIQLILTSIEEANQKLLDKSVGSATTLAIAEIQNNVIRTYHVGDSMILMTGQRGKVKLETISHSPVGYAVEAGLVEEQDSLHHDERHLVSNVIGSQDMHMSIASPVSMARYDTLLVATDGLFDNLHKDEIIEIIRKGPLQKCAAHLKEMSGGRMEGDSGPCKPDDLSFILFRPAPG